VPNVFSTSDRVVSVLRQATHFDDFVSPNGMPKSFGDHVERSSNGLYFIPRNAGTEALVKRDRSSAAGVTDTPSKNKVNGRKKSRDAPLRQLSWIDKSDLAGDFFSEGSPEMDPVYQREVQNPDFTLDFADSDPTSVASRRHQYLAMSRHAEAQRALMQRGRDVHSEGISHLLDVESLRSSGLERAQIVAILRERLADLRHRISLLERHTMADNDGRVSFVKVDGCEIVVVT